jgi:phosphonate transport system substrate-binding protein
MRFFQPEIADKTRVIMRSPKFGFPPLVSRLGVNAAVVTRMKAALMEMADDPEARPFLEGLKLDGFGDFPPSLFDNIRRMADETRKAMPWLTSASKSKETKVKETSKTREK